jgi:hypothetical protein
MADQPSIAINGLSKRIRQAIGDTFAPRFTKKMAKAARDQIVKRTRLGYGVDKGTKRQVRLKPLSESYKKVRKGLIEFYTNKQTKQIFTVSKGRARKSLSKSAKASAKAKRAFKSAFELGKFNVTLDGAKKRRKRSKGKELRLKNLSSKTSPNKSNLTATGRMLNSLKFKGLPNRIEISVPATNHGKDLFGNATDVTHAELTRIHAKGATIKHPSGTIIKLPKRRYFDLTNAEKNKLVRVIRQSILKRYKK